MSRRLLVPCLVVALCLMSLSVAANASTPLRATISDVNDVKFAVNWVTDTAEIGQVLMDGTYYDDIRSEAYRNGFSHQVVVPGLTAETTYNFQIVSGGVTYADVYTVTTGATLSGTPQLPDNYRGIISNCDGSAVINDVIITLQVINGGGQASMPRSYIIWSTSGMWQVDMANARLASDPSVFIDYAAGDIITVSIEGPLGTEVVGTIPAEEQASLENFNYCGEVVTCIDNDGDGYGSPASASCTYPEEDCDDSNEFVNPGAAEVCDGVDNNCVAGVDEGGDALCADSSACTIDSCNGVAGCGYEPVVCDDENACNGIETCDDVLGCQAGTPLVCDDGDVCNGDEWCNPETGCEDGTPLVCDDGDVCNGLETCDATLGCQDGTPLVCDDGDVCNGLETCDASLGCQDGTPLVCDDNDVCNGIETCDASLGCQDGTPLTCDDGQWCNGTETCDATLGCQDGTPIDCDDGVSCTVDECNEGADVCDNTPNDSYCDNSDVCDGIETCDAVLDCQAGTPLVCDDGDVCNGEETCDASLGCQDGTPLVCDDGDVCNGLETCDASLGCQDGTPLVCDDGDVCNGLETCDASLGCQDGTPLVCDDGEWCNGEETCDATLGCQDGTPIDCNDGVACTVDECNEGADVCDNTPNDSYCDNSDICDGIETCDAVLDCQAGTPLVCDDNDVCNGEETCDATLGCQDGTPLVCDDNDVCNGEETCDATLGCQDGTPLVCDDNDVCNGEETCDATLGCQDGTPLVCDDGDVCNGEETCDATLGCQTGTPLECDNGLFCDGEEYCDTAVGCMPGDDPCVGYAYCCEGIQECSDVSCGCEDVDEDGFFAISPDCTEGNDCNDNDEFVYPGAEEICNGIDDNCEFGIDEGGDVLCDNDEFCDGAEICAGPEGCLIGPDPCPNDGAWCNGEEGCDEGGDVCTTTGDPCVGFAYCCEDGQYCDDVACGCEDADNDGFFAISVDCPEGDDCNDTNEYVYPGAEEVCNGIDDNCIDGIDEGGDEALCSNGDFCDGAETCEGELGCMPGSDPCPDDGLWCNGEEGCDEDANECTTTGDPCEGFAYCCEDGTYCSDEPCGCEDADNDGYFAISPDCLEGTDCDDNNEFVNPGVAEVCNGIDDNCVDGIDEGGDALCDNGDFCDGAEVCAGASGCQAGTNPCPDDGLWCTGEEGCDETGDTCTTTGDPCAGYAYCCEDGQYCDDLPCGCEDADNDGYYAISESCPEGDDCNDGNADVNPGVEEVGDFCSDTFDNDCDGLVDDLDPDCGACECPELYSVDPAEGESGASVDVALTGLYFECDYFEVYFKYGCNEYGQNCEENIFLSNVTILSDTNITGSVDLTDASAGLYDIWIYTQECQYVLEDAFEVTSACECPAMTGITPDEGEEGESVDVTITGANFNCEAFEIYLKCATDCSGGNCDPIPLADMVVVGDNQVTGTFNLDDAKTGDWDVVLQGDTCYSELAGGFEVEDESWPPEWCGFVAETGATDLAGLLPLLLVLGYLAIRRRK